jgi:hypothetical protein
MDAIPLGIYFQGLRKAAIYLHLIKKKNGKANGS